jgi:acetylornithine/N-succinyldiaminopimelate aminotransferase
MVILIGLRLLCIKLEGLFMFPISFIINLLQSKVPLLIYPFLFRFCHFSPLHFHVILSLAQILCENSFAKSVFFCNSGTEANEGALKFARKYTKGLNPNKTEYISFFGGFHGRSMGALSVTANSKYQQPFLPLVPGVKHLKLNDLPSLKDTVSDLTSAVIVEPIQGEGGINMATKDFLQELRELCTKKDVILIFDEIQVSERKKEILFLFFLK